VWVLGVGVGVGGCEFCLVVLGVVGGLSVSVGCLGGLLLRMVVFCGLWFGGGLGMCGVCFVGFVGVGLCCWFCWVVGGWVVCVGVGKLCGNVEVGLGWVLCDLLGVGLSGLVCGGVVVVSGLWVGLIGGWFGGRGGGWVVFVGVGVVCGCGVGVGSGWCVALCYCWGCGVYLGVFRGG